MKKQELLRDLIGVGIFILLIILFDDFIMNNLKILLIVFLFLGVNLAIIFFHEGKYKKNFPYKPYKSKNSVEKRILIGILAGAHYFFFIGNYNHKKYNTQVEYPETLECVFGNISEVIIFLGYIFIAIKLFEIGGYYFLLFMIIPIITNIISLKNN